MGKQRAPLEFSRLTGGIITEASPLTFPDSASLDEVNFELLSDGTRKRRLGFDFEEGHALIATTFGYNTGSPSVVHSFLWENVSGRNEISYAVIQLDNKLYFFRTTLDTLSLGLIGKVITVGVTTSRPFDFANIDGALVVVSGDADILTISADLTNEKDPILSEAVDRLTTRDLFGIQSWYNRDVEGGTGTPDMIDLTDPLYYAKRPLASGLPQKDEVATETFSTSNYVKSDGVIIPGVPGAERISSTAFSPSYFEGYEIKELFIYDGGSVTVEFTGGVPPFEDVPMYIPLITRTLTLERSSGGSSKYKADITRDEFDSFNDETGISFTLSNTTQGTIYNYNLRNQTFATTRLPKTGTDSIDPISEFLSVAGKFPSMSDTVLSSLYPNVEDDDNKTADRFHAEDLLENPLGTSPAPKGYFIIDALSRSDSRYTRWEELLDEEGHDKAELDVLPTDTTPGGATAVAEYGGRLWYGGFSEVGSVTEAGGTRLESYVLYSQLANNKRVVARCYQAGDPTSITDPELLETDGGFLSLDGAYGISRLIPIGTSLLVFAENGVWAVSGLDGNYFTPTAPRVQKITDKGSVSQRAVIVIDTSIIYWTKGGIYSIKDNNGTYDVENLVDKTIQSLYDEIPYTNKRTASGSYDSYSNEAFWVIYNTVDRTQPTEMLILKTNTGAFTKYLIEDNTENPNHTLVGYVQTPPYTLQDIEEVVTVDGVAITLGLHEYFEEITTTETRLDSRRYDTKGIIINTNLGEPLCNLSFGEFNNEDFLDWGVTDASAYMLTGYVSGGDLQRGKQAPYITTHFKRTETGFYADELGDLQLSHPSGCLIQAQWDWANSITAGRWSREAQAYRYPRHYMPADVNDPFDSGYATITTRNKIRGSGKVLSMQFKSEAGKDCHVLGWSTVIGVNENV